MSNNFMSVLYTREFDSLNKEELVCLCSILCSSLDELELGFSNHIGNVVQHISKIYGVGSEQVGQ